MRVTGYLNGVSESGNQYWPALFQQLTTFLLFLKQMWRAFVNDQAWNRTHVLLTQVRRFTNGVMGAIGPNLRSDFYFLAEVI